MITTWLKEQDTSPACLLPCDIAVLKDRLRFEVQPLTFSADNPAPVSGEEQWVSINPRQFVGHIILPSGRLVVISPKVPLANVFRLLAYVYVNEDLKKFEFDQVKYGEDSLLFEPLVQLLNRLVAERARRGLAQDYVPQEDNLRVFRGRVHFQQHTRENHHRPERLFCAFHERTSNIHDNRIVKHTLLNVLSQRCWSLQTTQQLRRTLGAFSDVDVLERPESAFKTGTYSRFTEDYRILHSICRMLLENRAFNDDVGEVGFNGFLLDMNQLFERFITSAFRNAAVSTAFEVSSQHRTFLSECPNFQVEIKPDIVVWHKHQPVLIADAKYKRDAGLYDNGDFYQMLAYGTALNCASTCLFYPLREALQHQPVRVRNSDVQIQVRGINLAAADCVSEAEAEIERLLLAVRDRQDMSYS